MLCKFADCFNKSHLEERVRLRSVLMPKLKLMLDFDGTSFCGWQLQSPESEAQKQSLQGALEAALKTVFRSDERVVVQGCGRTDAGVHAMEFVAHAQLDSVLWDESVAREQARSRVEAKDSMAHVLGVFRSKLNGVLPEGVAVSRVELVDDSFHALKDVREKCYEYRILYRPSKPSYGSKYVWWQSMPWSQVDTKAMMKALQAFEGEHDFVAFAASNHGAQSTVRQIFRVSSSVESWADSWSEEKGVLLKLRFVGSGFLKQMVRNMVGAISETAKGQRSVDSVRELLAGSKGRSAAGLCAPASGLHMAYVLYEELDTHLRSVEERA